MTDLFSCVYKVKRYQNMMRTNVISEIIAMVTKFTVLKQKNKVDGGSKGCQKVLGAGWVGGWAEGIFS